MARKYEVPSFLAGKVDQVSYQRWLERKAGAHLKRDKARGNSVATGESYKIAIHAAVITSNGLDAYTGEPLDWTLISRYDNAESKAKRREYKAQFALLPTVDHVGDGLGPANFKICSWRTNDAKHDLTHGEFVDLCRRVIAYSELGNSVP